MVVFEAEATPDGDPSPWPSRSLMITFACPFCQQTVSFDSAVSGDARECPHCREGIRVPRGDAAAGKSQTGLVVGIVVLAVVLLGCPLISIFGLAVYSVLGQKASTTFTPVGGNLGAAARSNDGACQVTLPIGWTQTQIPGNHNLQVSSKPRGLYLVVTSEHKVDFADNMKLREYARLAAKNSLANMEDARIESGPTETTINGRAAIQHEIAGTLKETRVKVRFFTAAVDGKIHFHSVAGWTTQSNYAAHRAELEQVVRSFREVE